jgi:hypothetical protein
MKVDDASADEFGRLNDRRIELLRIIESVSLQCDARAGDRDARRTLDDAAAELIEVKNAINALSDRLFARIKGKVA